ncbi:hypothetical protein T484DRAFT_1763267 [Baffinella frigidus]|nr:hypothetical protein T484DRAFT_1763267 [Cryptophyta sp. CCMP2293]
MTARWAGAACNAVSSHPSLGVAGAACEDGSPHPSLGAAGAACEDGVVRLFDVGSGKVVWEMPAHQGRGGAAV